MNLFERWWQGRYVPPPENDPDSLFILISPGHYERHWSARAASWLFAYARENKLAVVVVTAVVSWVVTKLADRFL